MDDVQKQEMVKRLRVDRDAESEEVLGFWRDHGTIWAREEATYKQIELLAEIALRTRGLKNGAAIDQVTVALKAIWKNGFADPADAYGWDEMTDRLPRSAYLAFIQGVERAWNEVRNDL